MPRPLYVLHLLTAPGVVLHEFAHRLVCTWLGVPVGEVVYFQLGSPAGYVEHGQPRTWLQALFVAVAPFVVNLLVGVVAFTVALGTLEGGPRTAVLGGALVWLGLSGVVHSVPSPQDVGNLWNYTTASPWRLPFLVVVAPLYALVLLVSFVGTFYVSVPLALLILAGVAAVLQVDAVAVWECLLQKRWGCWEARSVMEALVR